MPNELTNLTDRLKSIPISEARFLFTDGGDGNTLVCYPSVTGVLDLYGDVIFPGAFKTCLADFLRRGFNPTDHRWEWTALVAYPTICEERGNKLYSECVFHTTESAKQAKLVVQERLAAGKEVGLSIGFSLDAGQYIYFQNGKELLDYAKRSGYDLKLFDVATISAFAQTCCAIVEISDLWEYSLTPAPANQQAMAVAIKRWKALGKNISAPQEGNRVTKTFKVKTICGSRGLKLAPRDTSWSAAAAIKAIKEKTGATDAPNADFAKAFVVVDGPNDEFDSYKLPFADVKDGNTVAVFKAIETIAGVLNGARGGVELSDDDRDGAKKFVENYYAKAAKEFDDDTIQVPWADNADGEKRWKGQYLGSYVTIDMCMAAVYECFFSLYYEMADCITGYGDYCDMDDESIYDCIGGMCDEFRDLSLAIVKAIRGANGAETPEEARNFVLRRAGQILSSLGDGLPYSKQARLAVDATEILIERTQQRAAMRAKDDRTLSAQDRDTLTQNRNRLKECLERIDDLIVRTEPKDKSMRDRLAKVKAEATLAHAKALASGVAAAAA